MFTSPMFTSPMFTSHTILYVFVVIILLYLTLLATIRLKMQFWHTQPVFHFYNLSYWFNPPGFINKEAPPVNKFVNLINNKLINLSSEAVGTRDSEAVGTRDSEAVGTRDSEAVGTSSDKNIKLQKICQFIQDYYVIHPSAKYKPSPTDILAYLECTNQPAYFNVYQQPTFLLENGVPSGTQEEEIIGVISARVLNVTLQRKSKQKINFPVYYVDHLCVKPGYRKKGISPQMIQTFYYNVARANSKVNAYMFKREGTLTAIVPLVYYETHGFDITHLTTEYVLNPAMTLLEIGAQQLNHFIAFVKNQMSQFDCVILPDVSSVLNLIKLEKIFIYGILFGGELIAVYIFRPLELYSMNGNNNINNKTLECIAVISNYKGSASVKSKEGCDVLTAGFNMSLIKCKTKCNAAMLLFEETAHSSPVIADLCRNASVLRLFTRPTAFFLYNYACYSVKKDKTLLIY